MILATIAAQAVLALLYLRRGGFRAFGVLLHFGALFQAAMWLSRGHLLAEAVIGWCWCALHPLLLAWVWYENCARDVLSRQGLLDIYRRAEVSVPAGILAVVLLHRPAWCWEESLAQGWFTLGCSIWGMMLLSAASGKQVGCNRARGIVLGKVMAGSTPARGAVLIVGLWSLATAAAYYVAPLYAVELGPVVSWLNAVAVAALWVCEIAPRHSRSA